jgi:hypothetical protein
VTSWLDLVPKPYPDRHLVISGEGVDLRELTRRFDFTPLREVTEENASRTDLTFATHRYFIDEIHFDLFRGGYNIYTFLSITISAAELALEESGFFHDDDPAANLADPHHQRCMKLLQALGRSPSLQWRAFSSYADTGERSADARGDVATTFRAPKPT